MGQKIAKEQLSDSVASPQLGDEGGTGMVVSPAKPVEPPRRKAKKAFYILLGIVVGLICLIPLSKFEPTMYILAIVIALVALPLATRGSDAQGSGYKR